MKEEAVKLQKIERRKEGGGSRVTRSKKRKGKRVGGKITDGTKMRGGEAVKLQEIERGNDDVTKI